MRTEVQEEGQSRGADTFELMEKIVCKMKMSCTYRVELRVDLTAAADLSHVRMVCTAFLPRFRYRMFVGVLALAPTSLCLHTAE